MEVARGRSSSCLHLHRSLSRHLRRSVPDRVDALKDVSLVARVGESIGILGHNEAGTVSALSTPALLGVNAVLVPELSGERNVRLGCLAMGLEPRAI